MFSIRVASFHISLCNCPACTQSCPFHPLLLLSSSYKHLNIWISSFTKIFHRVLWFSSKIFRFGGDLLQFVVTAFNLHKAVPREGEWCQKFEKKLKIYLIAILDPPDQERVALTNVTFAGTGRGGSEELLIESFLHGQGSSANAPSHSTWLWSL